MSYKNDTREALRETFRRLEAMRLVEPIPPNADSDRSLFDIPTPALYEDIVPLRDNRSLDHSTRRAIDLRFPT
jgi:hypothetical protein